MRRALLLAIACAFMASVSSAREIFPEQLEAGAYTPDAGQVACKEGHPRLLLPAGKEPRIGAGSMLARPDSVIRAFSDYMLGMPPVERVMAGRRLQTSSEALKRIFWLSWTYRVHGGGAYARRAVEEMLAVCGFPDWNPGHFLDVGEITMAVAIGYDWLYDEMTAEEREKVADAIIEKGLKAARNEDDAWFYTVGNNWNSVCNAGMVYGALAVWEEDPVLCSVMLERSLESNKLAYEAYIGGGYAEGYNYWGYGTSFQIMLEAALETAVPDSVRAAWENPTGHDDFLASADFIRFMGTPAGNCFSFSDCRRKAVGQYMQAWMAGHSANTALLTPEMRILEYSGYSSLCEESLFPMYLISLLTPRYWSEDYPADHYFTCGGTTPVFVYRSGWRSYYDDYLGIKGGLSMSNHSHCDQGSFYFESDGVTWATDLGMQDYNSLESAGVDLWDMTWDSERWQVFRIGPYSHNILTVNGHVPKVSRPASFRQFWKPYSTSKNRLGAVLDLTDLYTEDLDSCSRAVWLQGDELHVVDLVQAGDSACTVRWAMCTEAETVTVRSDGVSIELGSGRYVRVLSAEVLDGEEYIFPSLPQESAAPRLPEPSARTWPVTYDPYNLDLEGMEYLHPTDAPNPGVGLAGYVLTLQPHCKVALHVCLKKVE